MTTGEAPIELIPPAFHILWAAAHVDKRLLDAEVLQPSPDLESPNRLRNASHLDNSKTARERFRSSSTGSSTSLSFNSSTSSLSSLTSSSPSTKSSAKRPDPTIIPKKNPELDLNRQQSFDLSSEIESLYAKETAAVCIMECERGEKLVKKSFFDIKGRHGRVKTEDYLLDWLTSDLISQHARTVDVTVYLSSPPVSTTSDGLVLWRRNLVDEGKVVSLSIKLASLGFLHPCYVRPGLQQHEGHDKNSFHWTDEPEDREETLLGLKRLTDAGVPIATLTPREWPELLSLLADKMALRHLEDSHTFSTNHLQGLLAGGTDSQ